MGYVFAALLGYLMGCSNLAFYIAKWKKVDFRRKGSGNLGASNTAVLMGVSAGILVAVHDIAKTALAVIIARQLFPDLENVGVVAGIAGVMGHIFPFYLKFKGGKGFASYFGMTLAMNWKLALAIFVVGFLLMIITDYIVTATMTTVLTVPVYMAVTTHNLLLVLILCVGTAVIIYKHWENFKRILNGTEIGMRSAARGDKREK